MAEPTSNSYIETLEQVLLAKKDWLETSEMAKLKEIK
jgi:hypothetical protein